MAGTAKVQALSSFTLAALSAFATVGASLVFTVCRLNVLLANNPIASLATILIAIVPTSAFNGVPLKLRVAALKLSHDGSASPLASLADRVNTSPASWSAKVLAGTAKVQALSSFTLTALSAFATVGEWLTDASTATLKLLAALRPNASVATTLMAIGVDVMAGGVPEKVRVVALKPSHSGRASPLAKVADRLSVLAPSTSANVPAGTV